MPLAKNGIYRFDSSPARFSAYAGEAVVEQGGQTYTVRAGRMLNFNSLLVERFDPKRGDSLLRWAKRRSEQLALANISSARSLRGGSQARSGWFYNSYLGDADLRAELRPLFEPFGWSYFSPYVIDQYILGYDNPMYGMYRRPHTAPPTNVYSGGGYQAHESYVSTGSRTRTTHRP